MADIARMLSKLDKALVARSELKKSSGTGSELKKRPIEKKKNYNMAKYRAMGESLRRKYGGRTGNSDRGAGDRPWLDHTARSPTGETVNSYHFPAGLPYARVDPKSGVPSPVPRNEATPIPRLKEEKGADGIIRMVPDVDPTTGEIKEEPMPYNGKILLDPFSTPRFMPITYRLKKIQAKDRNGNPKFDRNGEPVMRLAKDKLGRYIPELDEKGNRIPLIRKDDKGNTYLGMMVNPDALNSEYVVNAFSEMRDAKRINDMLENGATWDEAMEWLYRAQEAELKNRDKDAWLKRLGKIFGEADSIGMGIKDENGAPMPRYAIDRGGMGWYRDTKDLKDDLVGSDVHEALAEKALKDRNPYSTPGMSIARPYSYIDPSTGEKVEALWHPIYGRIDFLTPEAKLKRKHLKAFEDAVGKLDRDEGVKREVAQDADQGKLYPGLTPDERKTMEMLRNALEQDPNNPKAPEWKKLRNELFRKQSERGYALPDSETGYSEQGLDERKQALSDSDTYLKEHAPVSYEDAINMAVRLVQKNPDIWYDLLGDENKTDLEDIVRLFTVLPRSVSEKFIETGTLSLEPVQNYTPSGRLSTGDVMRTKTINDDLKSRRSAAEKWLDYGNNKALAMRALEFFNTDEGKEFLENNRYSNPNDLPDSLPGYFDHDKMALIDAAVIILNEEGMEDERRRGVRNAERARSASELYRNVLDDAYDVPLPAGTTFTTPEGSPERDDELRAKQLEVLNRFGGLLNTLRNHTRRGYADKAEAVIKQVMDAYPGLTKESIVPFLEDIKEKQNTYQSLDPLSKDSQFYRTMSEMLGENPDAKTYGLAGAMKNQYGENWEDEVWGEMLRKLPTEVVHASNRLADFTRNVPIPDSKTKTLIATLKRLSQGDADSIYAQWADSLSKLSEARAEMNARVNEKLDENKTKFRDEKFKPSVEGLAEYLYSLSKKAVPSSPETIQMDENGKMAGFSPISDYETKADMSELYKFLADQLTTESSMAQPKFWPHYDDHPGIRRLAESAFRHKDVNSIWSDLENEAESTRDPIMRRMADAVGSYVDMMRQKRAYSDDTDLLEDKDLSKEGEWTEVMPEFRKLLQKKGFQGFDDLDFGNVDYGPMKYLVGDIGYDEVKGNRQANITDEEWMDMLPSDQQKFMNTAVQPGDEGYAEKRIVRQLIPKKSENLKPDKTYDIQNAYEKRENEDKPSEGDRRNWHNSNERERNLLQMLGGDTFKVNQYQASVQQQEARLGNGDDPSEIVTPLTDEDRALAAKAAEERKKLEAKNADDSSKTNADDSSKTNADDSVENLPKVAPDQNVPIRYQGKNLIDQGKIIGAQTKENKDKIVEDKSLSFDGREADKWKSGSEYNKTLDKKFTESDRNNRVRIMDEMRNMSLRDMMDSIAKNTGKDGHPYGAPIGGSVFAFGCVPVRMGGDGRERGMPADIPTAKTNDEGLTKKEISLKTGDKGSDKIEKGYFDKLVDGPVTGNDLRIGGSDDGADDLRIGGSDDYQGDLRAGGSDDGADDLRIGGSDDYPGILRVGGGLDAETARMIRNDNMKNNDYITFDNGYGIHNYTTKDDSPTYTNPSYRRGMSRTASTSSSVDDSPTYTNPSYGVLKSIRKSLYASDAGHIAEWPVPFRKYIQQNHPEIPDCDLQDYISSEW